LLQIGAIASVLRRNGLFSVNHEWKGGAQAAQRH